MSVYDDRGEADAEVIRNLIQEIKRLKGLQSMSHLLQLKDGRVISVEEYEVISPEALALMRDQAASELASLNALVSDGADVRVPAPSEAPAPVEAPAPQVQAEEVAAPAPVASPIADTHPVGETPQPEQVAPTPGVDTTLQLN